MRLSLSILGTAVLAPLCMAQEVKPETPKQPDTPKPPVNPIVVPHIPKRMPLTDFNKPVHGKWELVQYLRPHAQIDPLPRGILELREDGTYKFTNVDETFYEGKYQLRGQGLEMTRTTLFGKEYITRYEGLDYHLGYITRKLSVNAYEVWLPYKEKKKDPSKPDDKPKTMAAPTDEPIPGSIPAESAFGVENYFPTPAATKSIAIPAPQEVK